jgi:glyoxylase-like metal-dependent hydrolase (beta-lactamase superfamily II)
VITFDESLSVHFNGERIRVRHLPHAHTDGDAIVFFSGSNVVHMGDTFFSGTFPFVDVGNGGNVGGLIAGLRSLLEEIPGDARLIPGHGPLSTKKDLSRFVAMLEETSAIVERRVREGLGRDQVIEQGLPDEWESWGGGFISTERWLGILFDSQASGEAKRAARSAAHDESKHHD